jgi:serine/threonine protein kinase
MLVAEEMESSSPSSSLQSSRPLTSRGIPRPALKKIKSIKTQAKVQFAETESTSGSKSPWAPNREPSTPRYDYRPALQRTLSSTSTARRSHKFSVMGKRDDLSITSSHGDFSDLEQGLLKEDLDPMNEQHSPIAAGDRSIEQPSSARLSSRNIKDVVILQKIIRTLRKHKIPGPQLFRVEKEFTVSLGVGGEGNVRATDKHMDKKIIQLAKDDGPTWVASKIAIKRHGPQPGMPQYTLKNYLAAAEAEINALSNLFKGHPNIVQLRGWGFCLDTLENAENMPQQMPNSGIHLPLLVLERADGDLLQFLEHLFRSSDSLVHRVARTSPESLAEAGISLPREHTSEDQATLDANIPSFPSNLAPVAVNEHESSTGPVYHTPLMTVAGPDKLEMGLLSGSTLHGEESSSTLGLESSSRYATTVPDPRSQKASKQTPNFEIIKGIDRYEVLRHLLIDIGHGLHALHSMNMTHGDLKPQNILVFRQGPRWTAKVCDFGHSNSFSTKGQRPLSMKARYNGTACWRPHWFGAKELEHDVTTLKRFDLTVYGVLVWGAFCFQGSPPRISYDYRLSELCKTFEEDLEAARYTSCIGSMSGSKAALGRRIANLVQCTVYPGYYESKALPGEASKYKFNERPWEHLRSMVERTARLAWNRALPSKSESGTLNDHDTESQAAENLRHEPSEREIGNQNEPPHESALTMEIMDNLGQERQPRSRQRNHSNLSPRRHLIFGITKLSSLCRDHTQLENSLKDVLNDVEERARNPLSYSESTIGLWEQLARLRATEVRPDTWRKISGRENMVMIALEIAPPLGISTLAWLCKGEIGAEEVRSLPAKYSTWKMIVEPGFLNDSERLDRFLLLMQFGARVEKPLQGPPTSNGSKSILTTYLLNCRVATIPIVAKQICYRYKKVLAGEASHPITKYYMTAAERWRPKHRNMRSGEDFLGLASSTALGHIEADMKRYGAAYPVLKLNFEQLLDSTNDFFWARAVRQRPSETTPLFDTVNRLPLPPSLRSTTIERSRDDVTAESPIQDSRPQQEQAGDAKPITSGLYGLPLPRLKSLPAGWSQRGSAFLNETTQSVTLHEPRLQSQRLRRIPIGHIGTESVWEIDIADLVLYQVGATKKFEDWDDIRQRAWSRFPAFDEAWFAKSIGRGSEKIQQDDDDVLGDLQDECSSTSFEIKLPEFSAEEFLAKNLSTLVFFVQYPSTALGLLWGWIVSAHNYVGAPVEVSYTALRVELVSLDTASCSSAMLELVFWTPRVLWRFLVFVLACMSCLLGAALIVAIVLAFIGL